MSSLLETMKKLELNITKNHERHTNIQTVFIHLVLSACHTVVYAVVPQVLAAPSTINIRPLQGGYGATGAVRIQSHQHQHQAKMANRTKHQVLVRRIFNP